MSTSHATEKITMAIRNHLLAVDVMPPTTETNQLASDLTEVVWNELTAVGLNRDAVEKLFISASSKTKAQGQR